MRARVSTFHGHYDLQTTTVPGGGHALRLAATDDTELLLPEDAARLRDQITEFLREIGRER